jgi:dCTP deaminase
MGEVIMGILCDDQLKTIIKEGRLIDDAQQSSVEDGVVSYGLTSYGYDMRLGTEFLELKNSKQQMADYAGVIDPKNTDNWDTLFVPKTYTEAFTIEPYGFVLGVSYERFKVPDDMWGLVIGKSTYARCGLIVNTTPMEPGWKGYLTIELFNSTSYPLVVYPMEGIAQVSFFQGVSPEKNYRNKGGKYMNQPAKPIKPKVKKRGEQE